MKTTKVILLGAVVAAFAFTSLAADQLLSPRAKDNQAKAVASSIDSPRGNISCVASSSPVSHSPRAGDNKITVVQGTSNDVNPALVCQKTMTGSPKAVQACIESGSMKACMTVAPLK